MNIDLPDEPGLQRRLAYSNYIRNRNRSAYRDTYRSAYRDTYRSAYRDVDVNNTYEIFSEMESVEIGLTLENLLQVSSVQIEFQPFFCTICQGYGDDQLDEKKCILQISRRLICKHKFHIGCIEKWLSKNTSCPLCRYSLKYI